MSTTTMHFGPEWMRTKPQSASKAQLPPSPPASSPVPPASTYSSLLSSNTAVPVESKDEAHPFRYSKEEMLRIYREGGGKVGLGLEVERWEGVVRESGADPVSLKEMGETERKLFATSLNSDLRRRQSSDYLHLNTQNVDRPRLNHANSASATQSPLRERFGSLMTRRRDSSSDQPSLAPRKLSLTGQPPLLSPRETGLPSPRGRIGHTPSFDGVLNGGDSWIARRRASEGLGPKATANSARDTGEDSKNLEIREEDEENNLDSKLKQPDPNDTHGSPASGITLQRPDNIESGVVPNALDVPAPSHTDSPASTSASIGPPPGIDLASVDWSYLDPQGQVQGPFKAEIMQKWSDGGYFTDELLMKRTIIDNEWVSVGELKRRVGHNRIFLTPIPPPQAPPGLIRRTESPFSYGNLNEGIYNNGPFQPSPVRSLRSSTLDSFNSNYSDSPASSFGATGRFGNGSPDPAAFGGHAAQYAVAGEISSRLAGYPLNAGEASPALSGRSGFAIHSNDYRSPGFGSVGPGRGNSLDINAGFSSPATAWATNFDNGRGSTDSMAYQTSYAAATGNPLPFSGTNGFQGAFSTPSLGVGGMAFEQLPPPSPSTPFTTSISQQGVPDVFEQQQSASLVNLPALDTGITAPPWDSVDSPINKRSVPFDLAPSNVSTVNNQSPWGTGQVSRSNSQKNDVSPWLAASKGITDNWTDEQAVTSNLTVSNLSQHDEEEQLEETAVEVVSDIIPEPIPAPVIPEAPVDAESVTAPLASVPSKSRAKITSQQASTQQQRQQQITPAKDPVPESAPATPETELQPPVVSKAPWAKEDDSKKTTAITTTTSLRKIQDAEVKKAEARKAAEREKERAARAAQPVAVPPEDVQSFTTSWGLPTSKAGKSSVPVTPKEVVASPTPPVVTPPVWSATAPKPATAKKTMKEIQEEEERRKKAAAKETAANVASRRGYADSTSKSTPAPASSGNAWTTVGPGGKQTPTIPVRPPVTPSTTSTSLASSSTTRVNGAVTRPAPTPANKAPPINHARVDDFPVAPSTEFLKWLAESLKGLNSSVNVEDIMSMLLSFPLDPDPSTSEIISDLIYANSTTLDGRRFAADFLSKRKADAIARAKAGPGAAAAKTVSIADVVKAQPKPQAQSEWGGFKVVNKKKKGGRT